MSAQSDDRDEVRWALLTTLLWAPSEGRPTDFLNKNPHLKNRSVLNAALTDLRQAGFVTNDGSTWRLSIEGRKCTEASFERGRLDKYETLTPVKNRKPLPQRTEQLDSALIAMRHREKVYFGLIIFAFVLIILLARYA